MPRHARVPSRSGWAHIILRGINRENLFFDNEDYNRFISTTKRYLDEFLAEYLIICLMSNHVHILLKDENRMHAEIIKRIAISYAIYYNKKYDRVGHVFQDRFKSEAVEDEAYLLTVLRYIYQNPSKAGICDAKKYPYTFIEKNDILNSYFNTARSMEEFLHKDNNDRCLEYDSTSYLKDEEIISKLKEFTGSENPFYIQHIDKKLRNDILKRIKSNGASIKNLSRITGINRNIIQRA